MIRGILQRKSPRVLCRLTLHPSARHQHRMFAYTYKNEWKEVSRTLMEAKEGSWNKVDWEDALEAMRYWKGHDMAWQLMDRAVLEESKRDTFQSVKGSSSSSIIKKGLLSELVSAWKHSPDKLSARDIVQKLESYRSLVPEIAAHIKVYNMIVNIAIKSNEKNAHVLAQDIIESLTNGSPPLDNPFSRPNAQTFHNALFALSKCGTPDAAQRAEALVQKMQTLTANGWDDVRPDAPAYTSLIATWASSKQSGALQRAEELLFSCPDPSAIRFQLVIDGWAKSEDARSADRSMELFNKMRTMYRKGRNPNVKPVASTYGTAISALAKKGRAREAEALLEELIDEHTNRRNDPDLVPDRKHFNALIDAWAKSGEKGAAEQAEQILERMRRLARVTNNLNVTPDVTSYTSVLHAWAKSNEPSAAVRAELILQKMHKLGKAGTPSMTPNLLSYSTVLDCLANSRSSDAATRAESILKLMISRAKAGDQDVKPSTITFNTVINAFAKSRDPEAASKAEAIFDRMTVFGVHPDTSTFCTLISTWTNSGDPRAAEKAEGYLHKMKQLYEAGNETCKPDTTIFSSVINAWSTSKDPTAAMRARSILEEMKRLEAAGHKGCSPNIITYTSLLNVVAKSKSINKASIAWDLLSEMDQRSIPLDDQTYGSALMSCAFSRGYDRPTRERAFKIASDIIQRAHSNSTPSNQTYSFFFTSAAGLREDKTVELVYRWCCEAGYAQDKWIQRSLKLAAPRLVSKLAEK